MKDRALKEKREIFYHLIFSSYLLSHFSFSLLFIDFIQCWRWNGSHVTHKKRWNFMMRWEKWDEMVVVVGWDESFIFLLSSITFYRFWNFHEEIGYLQSFKVYFFQLLFLNFISLPSIFINLYLIFFIVFSTLKLYLKFHLIFHLIFISHIISSLISSLPFCSANDDVVISGSSDHEINTLLLCDRILG